MRAPSRTRSRIIKRVGTPKAAPEPKLSPEQKLFMDMATKLENGKTIREVAADTPISEIAKVAVKFMANKKNPLGSLGLSLLPTSARDVSISGEAQGDVTTSVNMYMYRPRRKRELQGVKYSYLVRWRGQSTSAAAQQAHLDVNVLDNVPVLNNPDDNTKYSNLSIKNAFDKFLIAQNKGTTDVPTDKFKLQNASIHVTNLSCELEIRNTQDYPITVDVYELVPQHNLGPTTYASEISATGYMSPGWAFQTGLSSDSIDLQTVLTSTDVGARPYDSVTFSRSWKQVKRLRLNLTAQSVHRHKSFYEINTTVSYQQFAQASTSGGKFGGWNPTFLIVHKGFPQGSETLASASTIMVNTINRMNYTGFISEGQKAIVFDDNL